jgi:hypothetical protein
MTQREISVTESDGYKRGGVAYSVQVSFEQSECPDADHTRVIHPDGSELPIQIDVVESWPDGSVQSGEIIFPLRLPADGSGTYILETGPEVVPDANQNNPVRIDETTDGLSINQGPVTYTVKSSGYNVVDTAVFNRDVWKGTHPTGVDISGPKSFLNPNSSAPILRMTDDTELGLTDPVEIQVETPGPRTGRIRVTGDYSETLSFTSHITLYSGVSWYRHSFALSGDTDDVASVVFEDTFDLAEGTLLSAFGSRVNSWDDPTSWAVITDGVSTIDVAATNAWGNTGYVRYESEADGVFRVIAPHTGEPIVTFYHFLITPPADHYHTPAGAMVAEPHIQLAE